MTAIIGNAPLTLERAKRAIKNLRDARRVLDTICEGEQPTRIHPVTARTLQRNGLVAQEGTQFRPATKIVLAAWQEVCAEEGGR